jgi:hypothetical protein
MIVHNQLIHMNLLVAMPFSIPLIIAYSHIESNNSLFPLQL